MRFFSTLFDYLTSGTNHWLVRFYHAKSQALLHDRCRQRWRLNVWQLGRPSRSKSPQPCCGVQRSRAFSERIGDDLGWLPVEGGKAIGRTLASPLNRFALGLNHVKNRHDELSLLPSRPKKNSSTVIVNVIRDRQGFWSSAIGKKVNKNSQRRERSESERKIGAAGATRALLTGGPAGV